MLNIYKRILIKNNPELSIRFELLEQLLSYISFNNRLSVSNHYLLKIIKCYLNGENYSPFISSKIDSIYLLCERIIDIYKANHFLKFNFILKEFSLDSELQKWIISSKDNIFKLCTDYLINNNKTYQDVIFFNQFFKITYIKRKSSEILFLPSCHTSGITIQILLDGKIYYNLQECNILLNQGEVLITSTNSFFKDFTIYSHSIEVLIIHLNYDFMKSLFINPNENLMKKYYFSNLTSDFKKILNINFFLKNPLFFYEILISLLKQGEIISNQFFLVSEKSNFNISNLIFCIQGNIKLSSNEIIRILENFFLLPKNKLDSLVFFNFKITLNKLIIKLKIDSIISDFFKFSISIETIIRQYNIKNINSFKYFLNIFYKINLKSLEEIKKDLN